MTKRKDKKHTGRQENKEERGSRYIEDSICLGK